MRRKISNQFMIHYLIVFLLSIAAAFFALLMMSFANDIISKTLVKSIYPASMIMEDDYTEIDTAPIVQNGGGVQIVSDQYEVVYSTGINTLGTKNLTVSQFTEFLVQSKSKGIPYHYDIVYNPQGKFWLIVTFPTSIRLDFSLVYNKEAASRDMKNVVGTLVAVIIFYLLLLALFAAIFSKITALRITNPLRKLSEGTKRLREGDYSVRVDLHLINEFAELQDTFNSMADKIERENALRRQSEDDRKQLILDISHDLKNPLASVTGYAELCLKKADAYDEEQIKYLQIIYKNSQRANRLLNELFELSKLESPEFTLRLIKTDICEYLRQTCGDILPALEQAGFAYDFDIPDKSIFVLIDTEQMSRVFHNLADNVIRYNSEGITVMISLYEEVDKIYIQFQDNGIGIPAEVAKYVLKPFVRVEDSRNSKTGGTGLGLSIAHKIVLAHGGNLELNTDINKGCTFLISLPMI
ncbi:MAG: HAMP domain-containing sensor histidine kinase [Herbinix sp.]|nr:HAMP domain-containing sensor histidine kinase [Herbinix sp.]